MHIGIAGAGSLSAPFPLEIQGCRSAKATLELGIGGRSSCTGL